MTSRLLVDKLEGKTTANTVEMPEGSVIQVKKTYYGANSGLYNSSSYSHITPYDVTITPKFSNSLMRVTWIGQQNCYTNGSSENPYCYYAFYQDSTIVSNHNISYGGSGYIQMIGGSGSSGFGQSVQTVVTDILSAGSTSSRTYKLYVKVDDTNHFVNITAVCARYMIVEEIAQ
jgi:hypothetical protein